MMNAFEAYINNEKIEEEPTRVTQPRILTDTERLAMKNALARTNGDITFWSSQVMLDMSFDAEMQRWINANNVKLFKR